MAVSVYTVGNNDILHETSVDFAKRTINQPVHLMQYDDTLPIINVKLFKNDEPYVIPEINNVYMYVRWGLKDHSFIHKPILGCSADRKSVYFSVDQQMLIFDGTLRPIIELVFFEPSPEAPTGRVIKRIAGSDYITIEIDRNPIQRDDIRSAYRLDYLVDVDVVTANPTVTDESPVLNSLGIGNVAYNIGGSGGGSGITPNPEEIPTEYLHSAKIDDDVYNIFSVDKKDNDIVVPIDAIVFEKI